MDDDAAKIVFGSVLVVLLRRYLGDRVLADIELPPQTRKSAENSPSKALWVWDEGTLQIQHSKIRDGSPRCVGAILLN
jgi:hypothetical protein